MISWWWKPQSLRFPQQKTPELPNTNGEEMRDEKRKNNRSRSGKRLNNRRRGGNRSNTAQGEGKRNDAAATANLSIH